MLWFSSRTTTSSSNNNIKYGTEKNIIVTMGLLLRLRLRIMGVRITAAIALSTRVAKGAGIVEAAQVE